MQASLD